MNKLLGVLLLLTFFFTLSASAQFGTQLIVDTSFYGSSVSDIKLTDMNNDGFLDIVLAHTSGKSRPIPQVGLFLNDTMGAFNRSIGISANGYNTIAIDVADFDLDGRMDVAGISKFGIVSTYVQGPGRRYIETDLLGSVFFPLDIATADFDQDGYGDILSLGDRAIMKYTNDSTANFDTSTVANFTEFYSFCVGDINGDKYPDLIAGSGRIFTFINDGKGNLLRDTTNESIITPQIHECELADMDGDNDLDFVVYYTNVIDKVDWYSNDGLGSLKKETTLTSMANNIYGMALGDIDLDSRMDISMGYDQNSNLVWIKNLGAGAFASEVVIKQNAYIPSRVDLGDIDNDGDLDLIHNENSGLFYYINGTVRTSSPTLNKIDVSWYPNPSKGHLTIEIDRESSLSIYNMHGVLVRKANLSMGAQHIETNLAEGNYVLELLNGEGVSRSILTIIN